MRRSRLTDADPVLMVRSVYDSMTKTEQKVADLALDDPEFFMFATVTDVSERADVGETTVIRFCRKVGFRGLQEFKLAIAQHLAHPEDPAYGSVESSDSLETALEKIATYDVQTLRDTAKLLQADSVKKAAERILVARRVYAFGVGSSGMTARDLEHRLMRIGVAAHSESDAHVIAMLSALAGSDDVIIGISASGSTKDLIDALTIARRNHPFIVCITNHARSPITHLVDVALLTAARETPLQGGALGTKIAQMYVLDALTSAIALANRERAQNAVERTAEAVVDKLL